MNKVVTITDTFNSVTTTLGTATAKDTTPYTSASFTDSRSAGGTAGTCTNWPNTAALASNDSSLTTSAGATVKVCVGKDLAVSKTATPYFTRTYKWTIAKAVDKTLFDAGGTATYTVTATETGFADSAFSVTGTITVTNPNDWESITFNLADAINNGGACAVSGGAGVTLLAGASVTKTYACTYGTPSATAFTNTATATVTSGVTPSATATGTAADGFTSPTTTVNKTITVTDTFNSTPLGSVTAPVALPLTSQAFVYTHRFTPPASGCVNASNTATITQTGQTASVTVSNCNTGALTMGYWQNKNGQAIITGGAATGGVCTSTTWLRQYAPFQDLAATSNCTAVGTYATNVIKSANSSGAAMNAMLKGQMLATALDVYFSDPALGGNKIGAPAGAPIGGVKIDLTKICAMIDASTGAGSCSGTYQNATAVFGGTNPQTVSQLLAYASGQSNGGGVTWYGNVKATQELAKNTFDAINNQVAVSP